MPKTNISKQKLIVYKALLIVVIVFALILIILSAFMLF